VGKNELKKNQFFDLALDLFCVSNTDGYFVQLNQQWEAEMGWSTKELMSKPYLSFVHPEDQDRTKIESAKLLEGKHVIQFENRFRRKNGEYRWLSWRAQFVPEQDVIYAVARDVTMERNRYQEFHQKVDFQGTILDTINEGIVVHESNGKVAFFNTSALTITGLTAEQLVNPSTRDAAWSWVREDLTPFGREDSPPLVALRTGKPQMDAVLGFKKVDGSVTWILGSSLVIKGPGGPNDWKILSTFSDITQRKASEKSLIQSAKMSSLGEMAGGVAHEINNPLAIIQGKASILKKMVETAEVKREQIITYLDTIIATSERIARIVKGLRLFSRNTEHDAFQDQALGPLLNETFSLCNERFKNHRIELKVSEVPEVKISCRPAEVSQVLLNLLNNSHDAIENLTEKWVEVAVSMPTPDMVRITVTDAGSGIPADVAAKMMQPFFTTKEVGRGTGLGLSISKRIIEVHGGKIYLDRECKNTRFVIDLPVAKPQAAKAS